MTGRLQPETGARAPLFYAAVIGGGLLLGWLGALDPELIFPLFVMGGLLLFLCLPLVSALTPEEIRSWAVRWFFIGLALRLSVAVGEYLFLPPDFFAPDQRTYDKAANELALIWSGEDLKFHYYSLQYLYPRIAAGLYYVFGRSPMAAKVMNSFAGALTPILVGRIAWIIFDARTARKAIPLCAVFPSLVLWSSLNLRDSLVGLTIALAVLAAVELQRSYSSLWLMLYLVALSLLAGLRDYMFVLVSASTAGAFFIGRRERIGRNLVIGVVLLMLVAVLFAGLGGHETVSTGGTLDEIQSMRDSLAGGGSSFAEGADISTPGKALLFLPIGLVYFLLAPFPWQITSALKVLSLPETLIWYFLFPGFVIGLADSLRSRLQKTIVPIAVIAGVTFSYALVEGNVGTAYRHRAQALILYFLFVAHWLELRRVRKEERKARREANRKALRADLDDRRPGTPHELSTR